MIIFMNLQRVKSRGEMLDLIRVRLGGMSAGERCVGEYVLAFPEKVVRMSILEVRDGVGTSYGTVSRFCQRVGCKGFQEFKILLAQSLPEGGSGKVGQWEDVRERVACCEATSGKYVDDAVELLDQAERIVVLAVGGSRSVGMDLHYRLNRLGKDVRFPDGSDGMLLAGQRLGGGDLCLVVSFSGATQDLVTCVEEVRKQGKGGAKVLLLSNYVRSPLAELSDCVVACGTPLDAMMEEVAPKVAFTAMVDVMVKQLIEGDVRYVEQLRSDGVLLSRQQV